jgi:hypothetical protein
MCWHYLWLDVECDSIYTTNGFLITNVDTNLFIDTNYWDKLTLFF